MLLAGGVALAATIDGTNRGDRLGGTQEADTIRGLGGGDFLYGRGGPDSLSGNSGNDTVYGGDGDDVLRMRDGAAGNDAAHCGIGYDIARVDSRGEASIRDTSYTPVGEREDALCEAVLYRAEATGVLRTVEICADWCDATHYIADEASNLEYRLESETVGLSAYEEQRVTVSGPVTERPGNRLLMEVERVEKR